MSKTLLHPPSSPAGKRTAFERNLLPGFARWFVEQVERTQPDYLVPAETKGARILDSALAYARDVLGVEIAVPVLYSTALAYADVEDLARSRVLILDDAIRTGQNLARHTDKLRQYGVRDVHAVACVGYADDVSNRPAVPCFRFANAELYRDYVWQLTELVVARGLPPEVDHHVFDLRLPERLPLAWATLRETSARHGNLSIDAPIASDASIVGMTLHFPRFPAACRHPATGPARIEGANKIRLFPDPARDKVEVVPVAFPALDLPPGTSPTLCLEDAWRLIRTWARRDDSIGELLVSAACTRTPETVFRALSTCTEVDLVCGLAGALGRVFPPEHVDLTARRDLFHRLYGRIAGERIAERIDDDIRAALHQGRRSSDDMGSPSPPLALDAEVVDTTRRIAFDLKQLYEERMNEPGRDPAERVGRSMSEIEAAHPEATQLLVSRCLDFGLAMTTLVPYIEVAEDAGGAVRVRRNYRVAENNRGDEPYEDQGDVEQNLSEETVALIAHALRTRVGGYANEPIPERLIAQLASILRPLVLRAMGIRLDARFEGQDPVVVLREGSAAVTLLEATSAMFVLRDGGIVPTRHFVERYETDRLRLDRRGCSEEIESCIELLRALLENEQLDAATRDDVLMAWASCTDGQLGLTHVRRALDASLRQLESPLRLILRDEAVELPHDAVGRARGFAAAAGERLAHLKQEGLSEIARRQWPNPNKRERNLLTSVAAPTTREIFEIPTMLVAMTTSVCALVERLVAAAEVTPAECQTPVAHEAARDVLDRCAAIERTLTTLSDDVQPVPVPSDVRRLPAAAAENLLRVGGMLRAFAAATAGDYRGDPRPLAVPSRRRRGSTVLFTDLSASFDHALRHEFDVDVEWKNAGLNLIAQWGKAFGASERRERKGDDIWLEFDEDGDSAALCAAAIQQHAKALRSSGIPRLWWGFRIAIDDGQLQDADGGNTIGSCLDRAAKLAKFRKQEPNSIERVLVTPEAVRSMSPKLQERPLASPWDEVRLSDVESRKANFTPRAIDAAGLVEQWCSRLCSLAQEIARDPGAAPMTDAALDVGVDDDSRPSEEAAG